MTLLALIAAALVGSESAKEPPQRAASGVESTEEASVDVSGRVVTRELADGRLEFCFQPTGQAIVCPDIPLRGREPSATRSVAAQQRDHLDCAT